MSLGYWQHVCFPLAGSVIPILDFCLARWTQFSNTLVPLNEKRVVRCWQIFWNINELMGLTTPVWVAVCSSSCTFIYFVPLGEERWTSKSQNLEDSPVPLPRAAGYTSPFLSLSFLIWKRTVLTCAIFALRILAIFCVKEHCEGFYRSKLLLNSETHFYRCRIWI